MGAKHVIGIDPGIHTGVSIFTVDGAHVKTLSFTCNTKSTDSVDRVWELSFKLGSLFEVTQIPILKVYIEGVNVYATSERSMASATRGNLSLLAYIVGAYIAITRHFGHPVSIVSPSEWKGQLPYPIIRKRLEQKGLKPKNDHEASAQGIVLWALGRF